jgi:hypothetical protein
MDKIYNSYSANPKITITKTIRGKRGFNEFVKAVFGVGRKEAAEREEWVAGFTEEEKKYSVFFTYKRKLTRNYKVGVKLIIDRGATFSVLGEEYSSE